MNFISRIALVSLAACTPVLAQDTAPPAFRDNGGQVVVDTNLFCDTREQVERFAALFDDDQVSAEAAIAEVNAENKMIDACVIATTAYQAGETVGTIRANGASFDIAQITVVGVYTYGGLEQSKPTPFFTMIPHDEKSDTVGQR